MSQSAAKQTARQRSARYRERQRNGIVILEIRVQHEPLTYALELAGLLAPELIDDRYAIAKAVESLLQAYLERVTRPPA